MKIPEYVGAWDYVNFADLPSLFKELPQGPFFKLFIDSYQKSKTKFRAL